MKTNFYSVLLTVKLSCDVRELTGRFKIDRGRSQRYLYKRIDNKSTEVCFFLFFFFCSRIYRLLRVGLQ